MIYTLFDGLSLLLVVKGLLVILLLVYLVFAFLMMRQISSMTRAILMQDDYIIRGIGIIHFVFAVVVFLTAIFVNI